MLTSVIAFEWRYHTRQVSFLAACLLFLAFGFALSATGFGPDNVAINSPFTIMESVGLLSLMSLFVLAVFSANAMLRDRDYRMEEIVYATAIEKRQFLAGRFAGSFLAAFTSFSVCLPGMVAGTYLVPHDAARVGPPQLGAYLWALLVLALPNLLLAATIIFAIATITRSLLASSIGAVVIYVLYFVVAAWSNSPLMASSVPGGENGWVISLFDPFGLSPFFEQTRYWTAVVRNTRLTQLSGRFLANRLLWLAVTGAGWALLHRLFRFGLISARRPAGLPAAETRDDADVVIPYFTVQPRESPDQALRSAVRIEARILRTLPFLALLVFWAALAMSEIASDVGSGEYGSANYATTDLVFGAMESSLQLIGLIVLTYFSAEMLWRERALRMNGILNATPAPSGIFVVAKWIGLALLPCALLAVGIVVGIAYQLAHGVPQIEWSVIAAWVWFNGAPLVLFATLAVLVHTVAPHKYLGLMLVMLLAVFMRQAALTGALHHLWAFGSAPPPRPDATAFNWYMLHWTITGALLLTAAAALWRRPAHFARAPLIVLSMAAAASAAHILYQTTVLNRWESAADIRAWRAAYERIYGKFASLPQPRVVAVEAQVDLFPSAGGYGARGRYLLRNDSSSAIDRFLISVPREMQSANFARDRYGCSWIVLAHPLAPGATTAFQFDVSYAARGFSDQGQASSPSFLAASEVLPAIGYRRRYELTDPADRRKEGLPPRDVGEEREEGEPEVIDWVTSDVTLATDADQIAVTSGRRVGEWASGGRRYFRYRSDGRIPNALTFASGRYRMARSAYRDIAIEIDYVHPTNVPRMMQTAQESVRIFERSFGAYPHHQLKIVEVAVPGFSGQARPDTVFIGERRGFLIDLRDAHRLDLVARRLSHEIAHQWWGGLLTPADRPGATVLSESLTKYAELLVLEKMQGREALRRSLTYELDLYLSGRTAEPGVEPPLARAGSQSYLYYRKGALVMNALHDLLGERLDRALRAFLSEEGGPGHAPVVAQLLLHLRAVATPGEEKKIDEWFERVVLADLKMESARSRRLADGRFEVTMTVRSNTDDQLEIALFEVHPDRTDDPANVIYDAKKSIRSGANTIAVVVGRQPRIAAIDPNLLRIDRNRFDNFNDVKK